MTADAIAAILAKQGPLALTVVILAMMLFAVGGAFIAFVKWSSQNTVPVGVYDRACDCIEAKLDALRLDVAAVNRR